MRDLTQMKEKKSKSELDSITEKIIGAAYSVSNKLGIGFLEKVYENALCIELLKLGLFIEQQKALQVRYDDHIIGEYYSDVFVENSIVVELKTAKKIDETHMAQLLNYLKACNKKGGIDNQFWENQS